MTPQQLAQAHYDGRVAALLSTEKIQCLIDAAFHAYIVLQDAAREDISVRIGLKQFETILEGKDEPR